MRLSDIPLLHYNTTVGIKAGEEMSQKEKIENKDRNVKEIKEKLDKKIYT